MKKIAVFQLAIGFILLASFFQACKKTPIEQPTITPPPPGIKTRLNVLWQKPLHPDTVEIQGSVPHVLNGDFIYQTWGPPAPTPLVRRNGNTGEIVWEWHEFFKYDIEAAFEGFLTQIGQNFVISDGFGYYGIDGINAGTIWSRNISAIPGCCQATGYGRPIGNFIYSAHYPCGTPFTFDGYLVRYEVHSGQLDTVCHLNGGDTLFVGISDLSQWIEPSTGDTILIITNNGLKNNPPKSNQTIYQAWNVSSKQWFWAWSDPTVKNGGTWNQIYGDRLYLQTAQKLICLEVGTWKLLWQRDYKVPNSAGIANVIEYNNQLIVKCDDREFHILNPQTGALLWQLKETGGTPIGGIKLFEGVVYYTSAGDGRIYAIDVDNRKLLWAEDSPNAFIPRTSEASFFMAGVAIDTVNRRLFTCDKFYAMSIKLPK